MWCPYPQGHWGCCFTCSLDGKASAGPRAFQEKDAREVVEREMLGVVVCGKKKSGLKFYSSVIPILCRGRRRHLQ